MIIVIMAIFARGGDWSLYCFTVIATAVAFFLNNNNNSNYNNNNKNHNIVFLFCSISRLEHMSHYMKTWS